MLNQNEQLTNGAVLANDTVVLQWNELLSLLAEEATAGDRCPILTF